MYYLSKIIKLLLMGVSYKVNKMSYLLLKITCKGSKYLNVNDYIHILGNEIFWLSVILVSFASFVCFLEFLPALLVRWSVSLFIGNSVDQLAMPQLVPMSKQSRQAVLKNLLS